MIKMSDNCFERMSFMSRNLTWKDYFLLTICSMDNGKVKNRQNLSEKAKICMMP